MTTTIGEYGSGFPLIKDNHDESDNYQKLHFTKNKSSLKTFNHTYIQHMLLSFQGFTIAFSSPAGIRHLAAAGSDSEKSRAQKSQRSSQSPPSHDNSKL